MLTPKYYWRGPVGLHHDVVPAEDLELPEELAKQRKPPRVGDGLILATYCDETSTSANAGTCAGYTIGQAESGQCDRRRRAGLGRVQHRKGLLEDEEPVPTEH